MPHDPRWCFEHSIQVFEFRVPATGQQLTFPVTESRIALADPDRLQRHVVALAQGVNPEAQFRRRLVPYQTGAGDFAWREV